MSKVNPVIAIVLDKERHLKLDLNAMVAYEEATGQSLLRGIDLNKLGVRELRALLWACLIHEDESLTLKQVGAWVNIGNMDEIARSITGAFEAAMPEAEKQGGKKKSLPLAIPPAG